MKNNKVIKFLKSLKVNNDKLLNEEYKPKFEIGNVIINEKFKVVSIVTKIVMLNAEIRDKNTGTIVGHREIKTKHYILKDLENKAAQEFFARANAKLDKNKRKRWKECKRIDSTYKLIDSTKAQLLYGNQIENLEEKYEKNANIEKTSN